jgi:chromosome segregation ATPase
MEGDAVRGSTSFESEVMSMLSTIEQRLATVEVNLRAIADAERAKQRYVQRASDVMRRVADRQ